MPQTLAAYHAEHGHKSVTYHAFYQRVHTSGWKLKDASTTPIQKRRITKQRRAKRR